MDPLHYLTVQDILWINLQVTKKVQHFNYARLEEATFYQYSYGDSNSLHPQAARFVSGFLKMHPFESGNEATALIGCGSFLRLNGERLNVTDDQAQDWLEKLKTRTVTGLQALEGKTTPVGADEHHVIVRSAIEETLGAFPCTILSLNSEDC